MKDSVPAEFSKPHTFSVIFSLFLGKYHRTVVRSILVFAVVILAGWLIARQIPRDAGLRGLVANVYRLPKTEQLKPIACSRIPLVDGPERATLAQAAIHITRPEQRATAYCLLGDVPSALAAYHQAALAGDGWSALQVYFIQERQGEMQAAQQALSGFHFSIKMVKVFFTSVTNLKLNLDMLPVARRVVELYPNDPESWKLWWDAARVYERALNWQGALAVYREAIRLQEQVGVSIGRSSFELSAGRIYQTQLEPRDLNSALLSYDRAIAGMDFLGAANPSNAFLYRGEVYQGLRPAYTNLQVLQEFKHSLELDPKNYWAMRAIGSVYLNDFKDYPSAEFYIDQAIGLNPDLPHAYLIRGDLYRQQGSLPKAIAAYQDALIRQPGWQAARDRLAAVQAELHKQAP